MAPTLLSTTLFVLAMAFLLPAITVTYLGYSTNLRNTLLTLGWTTFAVFWASRFEYYVFQTRSFVYLFVVPAAVIGCLIFTKGSYDAVRTNNTIPAGYLTVTKAGAIASVLYMPFTLIEQLRRFSIEFVTTQVHSIIYALGITNVTIGQGPEYGYQSALIFSNNGHTYITHIAPNCTGIGSMAIVVAVLWVTDLPVSKKGLYSVISVLIIHIFNLFRNIMIAVGFGNQWFKSFNQPLGSWLGYEDPNLVSFFIADKILAQLGSAIVLLLIFYFFLKTFPEIQDALQDVLDLAKSQI